MIRIYNLIMIYFESNISIIKNMSIPYLLVFIADSKQVLSDEKVSACVSRESASISHSRKIG